MTLFKDNIFIQDYMNLVLVANDLKPATGLSFQRGYGHNCHIPRSIPLEKEREAYAPIKKQRIREYIGAIEKFPLKFETVFKDRVLECDTTGCNQIYFNENVLFYIAKDNSSLDKLVAAKTHIEQGEAYGFPKAAITFFSEGFSKGKMLASNMWRDMANAIEHGISIPLWFAYISHVPEKTDFLNNDLSESSKAQGLKYQSFIRQNHPDLAELIEDNFVKELPLLISIGKQNRVILDYPLNRETNISKILS